MMIITAIVVILLIAGGILYFKTRDNQADEQPAPEVEPAKPSPEKEYETIVDTLLKLNLLIRKDRDLSPEILQEIEEIIDDLKTVIPSMMERYPGETLTYEMKKIGSTHLYKTVKEFLDLSPESRSNQAGVFKQTIDSLKQVSNRSRDIVEKNETAEFKTMASFLAGKFS